MHKRSAVLLLALFAIGCGAEKETAKSGSTDGTKVTFSTPGMT